MKNCKTCFMAAKFVLSLREEQKSECFWKEGASETRLI